MSNRLMASGAVSRLVKSGRVKVGGSACVGAGADAPALEEAVDLVSPPVPPPRPPRGTSSPSESDDKTSLAVTVVNHGRLCSAGDGAGEANADRPSLEGLGLLRAEDNDGSPAEDDDDVRDININDNCDDDCNIVDLVAASNVGVAVSPPVKLGESANEQCGWLVAFAEASEAFVSTLQRQAQTCERQRLSSKPQDNEKQCETMTRLTSQ